MRLSKGKIVLLWSLFIMILMGIPGNYFPQPPRLVQLFSPDKIIHLFLFSLLYVFVFRYLKCFLQRKSMSIIHLFSFIYGMIYGAITEILQAYIFVRRSGNYVDWLADVIGLSFGFLIIRLFLKK